MLHGDTPYASCKLEGDLKYNLSLPFDRSKVKASISADLREVIFRCLEVDEGRRISVAELRDTEYFRRIYRELSLSMYHQLKDSVPLTVQSNISADKR
jgi:serine/threonine protein kinase